MHTCTTQPAMQPVPPVIKVTRHIIPIIPSQSMRTLSRVPRCRLLLTPSTNLQAVHIQVLSRCITTHRCITSHQRRPVGHHTTTCIKAPTDRILMSCRHRTCRTPCQRHYSLKPLPPRTSRRILPRNSLKPPSRTLPLLHREKAINLRSRLRL